MVCILLTQPNGVSPLQILHALTIGIVRNNSSVAFAQVTNKILFARMHHLKIVIQYITFQVTLISWFQMIRLYKLYQRDHFESLYFTISSVNDHLNMVLITDLQSYRLIQCSTLERRVYIVMKKISPEGSNDAR